MQITRKLADFSVSTASRSIPAEVRRHTVRTLVNWVGCALGGAHDETVLTAQRALAPFMGAAEATVIGHYTKADMLHAALLNAVSSHVLDFDDTHLETLVHPSGPVLAALLALAQHQRISGSEFIDAAVMGIEVECRIAQGLGRAHYDAGWHVTGTAGVCGAAVAASRILRLEPQQMTWAIGIAATQASGLREMFGSMCKSLHAGKAAQNGLSAAIMAQMGFTSSAKPLEGPRGMLAVMSADASPDRIVAGLGEHWETLANTFKPYACGLVIHPVIDACRELAKHDPDTESIAEVILHVHPLVVELTGKHAPTNALEAKFSVYHCAAATLIDRENRLSHFSTASVKDANTAALRSRIRADVREHLRADEAGATMIMTDGTRFTTHVDHALGSLERPMSEADLTAKFHVLARSMVPEHQIGALLDQLWSVESCPDIAPLAEALCIRAMADEDLAP